MYIIVNGNPVTGYVYTGPFEELAQAHQWAGANIVGPYWWSIELDTPE